MTGDMVSRPGPIPQPPEAVQIARKVAAGRYRLLTVFPGLDRTPPFERYPCPPAARQRLAEKTWVRVLPRKGEWMYVAPHGVPANADSRWRPVTSRGDCIVVGRYHLRQSPALVLYLDVLHELCHVVQRWDGRSLWDEAYAYVDRPTEVEAYRFVVEEARRLRASDAFLREYLKVDWVGPKDHRRLLTNVGVSPR